jgi:hypothetical protein
MFSTHVTVTRVRCTKTAKSASEEEPSHVALQLKQLLRGALENVGVDAQSNLKRGGGSGVGGGA